MVGQNLKWWLLQKHTQLSKEFGMAQHKAISGDATFLQTSPFLLNLQFTGTFVQVDYMWVPICLVSNLLSVIVPVELRIESSSNSTDGKYCRGQENLAKGNMHFF